MEKWIKRALRNADRAAKDQTLPRSHERAVMRHGVYLVEAFLEEELKKVQPAAKERPDAR